MVRGTIVAAMLANSVTCIAAATAPPAPGPPPETAVHITALSPDARGGRAYRLVYRVAVPVEVMWRFKTDFDNTFLLDNKYIEAHRQVSRRHGVVITEDRYAPIPAMRFTWQTTLSPPIHRLDFKLLDAGGAGQRFHYGYIELRAEGSATRVTQVAYFDFFGVGLWAGYPWGGGMDDFLTYTARWEQSMARRRMPLYLADPGT